jgi:WD40 repeat protein
MPLNSAETSTPQATRSKTGRMLRPRFTLRTLLIAVLLIGSGTTLWWHWRPWVQILQVDGHDAGNQAVAFSPDGRWILSNGQANDTRVRDAATGVQVATMECHMCAAPTFSPDSQCVITCGASENKIHLWNVGRQTEVRSADLVDMFQDAHYSPDEKSILLSHYGTGVTLLDAATLRQRLDFGREEGASCSYPIFYDNGTKLICAVDRSWKTFDAQTGKPLAGPTGQSPDSAVGDICLSPDGHKLISYSADVGANDAVSVIHEFLRVWNVDTGTVLCQLNENAPGGTPFGEFSPDGSTIVTGSGGSSLTFWDANSLSRLMDLDIGGDVWGPRLVRYSPGGSKLLVAATHGPIYLFQRNHPESRFGILVLPELWLTILLVPTLLWSLGRDWRLLRGKLSQSA